MKKFIPYEKLTKKEKHKVDSAKRRQWSMCPASKVVPDKKKQADKRMCRTAVRYSPEI